MFVSLSHPLPGLKNQVTPLVMLTRYSATGTTKDNRLLLRLALVLDSP